MRRLELAGQRFGRWTALHPEEYRPGVLGWLCICECGNEGVVLGSVLAGGKSKQCRDCRFDKRPGLGARWLTAKGYVVMRANGHPNAWANGNMNEHVYVMSQTLGRPLLPGENVHHINGVKNDNRPENLELWVSHQPQGQRIPDLIEWAQEILNRYGQA